jgi:hypothetical protein
MGVLRGAQPGGLQTCRYHHEKVLQEEGQLYLLLKTLVFGPYGLQLKNEG